MNSHCKLGDAIHLFMTFLSTKPIMKSSVCADRGLFSILTYHRVHNNYCICVKLHVLKF